jgi:hypothetical protein
MIPIIYTLFSYTFGTLLYIGYQELVSPKKISVHMLSRPDLKFKFFHKNPQIVFFHGFLILIMAALIPWILFDKAIKAEDFPHNISFFVPLLIFVSLFAAYWGFLKGRDRVWKKI